MPPTAPVPTGMVMGQCVISAHRKPDSSRAIAVATTLLWCRCACIRRKRVVRRCCAVHARVIVAAGAPACRRCRITPTAGRYW